MRLPFRKIRRSPWLRAHEPSETNQLFWGDNPRPHPNLLRGLEVYHQEVERKRRPWREFFVSHAIALALMCAWAVSILIAANWRALLG